MKLEIFCVYLFERFKRYEKRYKNPRIVALKLVYYILSNLFKIRIKAKPSDTWYKLNAPFDDNDRLSLSYEKGWNIPKIFYKSDEHLYFSIDRALKIKPDLKGVWLVFFMGIGDYFMASAFVEQLRKTYPNLEFNAFVSKNFDGNNSPIVADILKTNPNISRVELFDGYPNKKNWKNYDCSNCYDRVADDYLLIPVIYEYAPYIVSRHKTLCETFSLEVPNIMPLPVVYETEVSDNFSELYNSIKDKAENSNGIIFLQLECRSASYKYSYFEELAKMFLDDNYVVVSFNDYTIDHPNYVKVDVKKISINESVDLLKRLKNSFNAYCITLNSNFWTISAALGIPNLGLQFKNNPNMLSEYFPNIYCITQEFIKGIHPSMQFVASGDDYNITERKYFDLFEFEPKFVYSCFNLMMERLKNGK